MYAVIGPVYAKGNGYAFDVWVPNLGLLSGFVYSCAREACDAREAEISGRRRDAHSVPAFACETADEFISEVAVLARQGHGLTKVA